MNTSHFPDNTKPETVTRFASLAIDYLFCAFLSGIIAAPFFIRFITNAFSTPDLKGTFPDEQFFFSWWGIMVAAHAIYLSKDIINGRSPAKRIFNLQILNSKTGQVASPMKCFIRNIPTLLWIVELIMALVNPEKRLGDMMASTKLARYTPETVPQPNFKFYQIVLPFLAAVAFSALLFGLILLPFLAFRSLVH